MATTQTLLEAVNDVLVAAGERQVDGIGNYPSLKAKSALESSLSDIQILQDWVWLKKVTPALSWEVDKAILPPIQRLLSATYVNQFGYRQPLRHVTPDLYPWYEPIAGLPEMYVYTDAQDVRVHPYPDTIDIQQKILFHYIAVIFPPQSETQTYPIPSELYELLKRGALFHFSMTHLDDRNASQHYKQQFDEMATRMVMRQPAHTINSSSMWRRRR
jgi:hypothetical protein